MAHVALTYHIVFGTYSRMQVIPMDHERELYKFMHDFMRKRDVHVRRIGGMPDHVHILCDIPPKLSVASLVQTVKTESSKFMKVNPHFPNWFGWADSYGAFTVDPKSREVCRQYIMNQKQHHICKDFVSEYREMLDENGLSPDTAVLGDEIR